MHLVAIAWIFVVVTMALAEALSPDGSVLGAMVTLLFYGALPLSIVLYVMATPARRRRRAAAEARSAADPHRSSESPADAVAPVREEP
jgi:hypothetical protein